VTTSGWELKIHPVGAVEGGGKLGDTGQKKGAHGSCSWEENGWVASENKR